MSNQAEEPSHDATPEVEIGVEEPPSDVLEQHRTDVDEDELEEDVATSHPFEADAADVEEQRRSIPSEDDWREE